MGISILPLHNFRCLCLVDFLIEGGGNEFVFLDSRPFVGGHGDGAAVDVELDVDGALLHNARGHRILRHLGQVALQGGEVLGACDRIAVFVINLSDEGMEEHGVEGSHVRV